VDPTPCAPSLLVHDGELDDVRSLLEELAAPVVERRGNTTPGDEGTRWRLVVSTPKRLLELAAHGDTDSTLRIALLEKDSRTLRSMLQRAGVDLIVRRPVHRAALRLLLLHALYRGPEKRRNQRVSSGTPVSVRTGLRRRSAVLADLSTRGCRLLTDGPLPKGRDVVVAIPPSAAGKRALRLRGLVVRTSLSELPGSSSNAIGFRRLSARAAARLREMVTAHALGPAVLPETPAGAPPEPRPLSAAPAAQEASPAPSPVAVHAAAGARSAERRSAPRHAYSQPVIALGAEAARVLLGRDISLGGMRVDPSPSLTLGDELRIGLHLGSRGKPLVVAARVSRDDGEDGLLLSFPGLSQRDREALARLVGNLPFLAVDEDGRSSSAVVVSEILDAPLAAARR
jgi:hypothetical protein